MASRYIFVHIPVINLSNALFATGLIASIKFCQRTKFRAFGDPSNLNKHIKLHESRKQKNK